MGYNPIGYVPSRSRLEVIDVPRKFGSVRSQDEIRKASETRMARLPLPIEEIVTRYRAGESEKSLGAAFGVSRQVIKRRLEIAGVERRSMSEAIRLGFARLDPAERKRIASFANTATRGRPKSFETKCLSALTRQEREVGVSPTELLMQVWLLERYANAIPQCAIGPYNADVAIPPVAVEIFGGGWHGYGRHKRRSAERYRYILNQGWSVIVIWVDARLYPLSETAADYVVARLNEISRNPSLIGQYWVIRGDGKEVAAGRDDLDQLTIKPPLN